MIFRWIGHIFGSRKAIVPVSSNAGVSAGRDIRDNQITIIQQSDKTEIIKAIDDLKRGGMKPTLSWKLPPDAAKTKNKIGIFAECSHCGTTVLYDDAWDDNSKVMCNTCGADYGTFGDFKRQARDAVHDVMKGNFWKYGVKVPD